MQTNRAISSFAVMLLAVATFALNGCTVMFGGLGALSDASKPNTKTSSALQVGALKPGATCTLVLKDGSRIKGKYSGLARMPFEKYAPRYAQTRAQNQPENVLPALGETVRLQITKVIFKGFDKNLEGTFEGFEQDRILITLKGTTVLSRVAINLVVQMAGEQSPALSGEHIDRLMREGRVPVMSAIALDEGVGKINVAINDVHHIEMPVQKNGASIGLAIGAIIDTAIIVVVSQIDWSLSIFPAGE